MNTNDARLKSLKPFTKGDPRINRGGRPKKYRTRLSMEQKNLIYRFGITPKIYEDMFEKQNGVCAICKKPETKKQRYKGVYRITRLAVDHDHQTNKIRGLLCYKCNTIIGILENTGLENVTSYLDLHSNTV